MAATKAKPTKPTSTARIDALEQHVKEQGAIIAVLVDTVTRVSDSQVAVLAAFEQLINEARKGHVAG